MDARVRKRVHARLRSAMRGHDEREGFDLIGTRFGSLVSDRVAAAEALRREHLRGLSTLWVEMSDFDPNSDRKADIASYLDMSD